MTTPAPAPAAAQSFSSRVLALVVGFIHAETSSKSVNTASRAVLAAIVAVAVAYAKAHGLY